MDRDDKHLRHCGSRAGNKRVIVPGAHPLHYSRCHYDNAPSFATTELDLMPRPFAHDLSGLPYYESTRMRSRDYPMTHPMFRAAKCTDAGF